MAAYSRQLRVPGWLLVLLSTLPLAGCGPTDARLGFPLPTLITAGWIGGPPPVAADLRGNVLVIDCWASW